MTLYRYYCRMRPPATGSIPKRNLHEAVAARINVLGERRQMYGFADYTQPLTDEEIEEYELVPCGAVEDEDDES